MNPSILVGLVNNAALLLALGLLYDILGVRPVGQKPALRQVLAGVVIGAIGIAIMSNPWHFGHGVVFDTRSVLLCIAGLFFGTLPTLLAMTITAAYRLSMGGGGVVVGVAVIATSGGVGLAWRHFRRRTAPDPAMGELYLLGVVVHLAMLAWMLILPWKVAVHVLRAIGLPVMLIHPLTTALLGMLLVNRGRRNEAEQRLRASEEKFRNIFEHHAAVKLLIDPDTGRIAEANRAAEAFYGWPVEQIEGMTIQEINTRPADQVRAEMEKARSLGRQSFQFTHRLADGSTREVEVYSSGVKIEGKEYLHSIIHDVTDRRRAEEALRKSEEYQRSMIAASPMAIISLDGEGRVRSWNHSAERMFGWPADKVLGRFLPIVSEERHEGFAALRQRVMSGESLANLELSQQRRDGVAIEVGLSLAPIRGRDGRPAAIMAVLEDITARKRTEKAKERYKEELERRNAFIQTILDNLPIGLAVNYIDEGKATYINREFEKIYGWPREELENIEEFFRKVYPDEGDRETMKRRIFADIQSGDPERMVWENTIVTGQDGSRKTVTAKNIPLYDQNLMISTVQDVTESNKLQRQLLQAQKMESVGRLAGGVAHDFNNMLSVILGYSEMLLESLGPDHEFHSPVVEIRAAARRSAGITRQLLAFARQQTIAPRVQDLNDTVQGMLKMLRRLIGEDIDLAWIPGASLWPVKMDPSQVDQLLANLCVNARDAIGGVGKVTIETQNTRFDAAYCADRPVAVEGPYVLLAVSDDGCGMDPETLANIFEPFFTTKAEGRGTGLGLATVYGIVKQNEGFIDVYSEPGEGTTFRIHLPCHEGGSEGDRSGTEVEPPRSRGEAVLLVEDEAPILRLAQQMLLSLGYEVLTAAGPEAALELAGGHDGPIDLLVTDVVMPAMSGRDLSRRLAARRPGIRTLYISGYTADVIAHRGVLDEGVHFLSKPFSKTELAVKVREVLEEPVGPI